MRAIDKTVCFLGGDVAAAAAAAAAAVLAVAAGPVLACLLL